MTDLSWNLPFINKFIFHLSIYRHSAVCQALYEVQEREVKQNKCHLCLHEVHGLMNSASSSSSVNENYSEFIWPSIKP